MVLLKDRYLILGYFFDRKYVHRLLPQKLFLKVHWRKMMGYDLNLDKPETFNEKLQWLKVYYDNPLYPIIVDKEAFKTWAANIIGQEYIIKTYKVYSSADQINLDELPQKFVLKCTHDSGSVIVCRNKNTFNLLEAQKKLSRRLGYNYYWNARETPYKKISHKIIAEELIEEDSLRDKLTDYKFFCFSGIPRLMYIQHSNLNQTQRTFFNMSMEHLELKMKYPNLDEKPTSIPLFKQMTELASILSAGFPFVRVDLYCSKGKIYLGELTFFHGGGFEKTTPNEWDYKMGKWIILPPKK